MNVIEDVRRQLSSTTVTSAGPPTEEIIKHFGECWVRKDQIYLLLAAAEAAMAIVKDMTPIEHPKSPTDYAYGKVTNEQWRALVAAIAPLLEEEKE